MTAAAPISFANVSKTFSSRGQTFTACKDLNFSVREGEVVAVVGETGWKVHSFADVAGITATHNRESGFLWLLSVQAV